MLATFIFYVNFNNLKLAVENIKSIPDTPDDFRLYKKKSNSYFWFLPE